MPFLPTAPVRIQPYFGYRNRDRLRITARALRSRVHDFEQRGRWRAAKTMLAQFVSHEVPELPVELEVAHPGGETRRHPGLTDGEGFVHFDIRLSPSRDYAAHPAWETVALHWQAGAEARSVDAHVLAPGNATGLGVISDIDDTIIETGITGDLRAVLRNWRRVLMQMPAERILVPGVDVFYNALGGGDVLPEGGAHIGARQPASQRPFFYVSSSPWNLFSYLVTYLRMRGLPLGPIALRDWGLSRATFGSASHGAHKRSAIEGILATYPDMKFALIGDDSQGDLPAFTEIALTHPGRVRAIFIRKLGGPMDPAELAAQSQLEAAGVPLWLGANYGEGHGFLAALGLLADAEAKAIVDTAIRADPAQAR